MADHYIVSLKHTRRDQQYITFWRKDDCGYAWPLSWAVKHTEAHIRAHIDYYHRGDDTLAVPCAAVDALAVDPVKGTIDGDAGPVVMNTRANWGAILAAAMPGARYTPQPQYKGARRQKEPA